VIEPGKIVAAVRRSRLLQVAFHVAWFGLAVFIIAHVLLD